MIRDTRAGTPHLRLLDLDGDDLLTLADDLHQLITLLHQLGLVHGCVHLARNSSTQVLGGTHNTQVLGGTHTDFRKDTQHTLMAVLTGVPTQTAVGTSRGSNSLPPGQTTIHGRTDRTGQDRGKHTSWKKNQVLALH